jgi:GntR family transcriptional regulator, transcriptional repressor for pyruvate dehydrogenase complex
LTISDQGQMPELPTQLSQNQIDELVATAFRFSGALFSNRDKMVKDLGLTSARWQVLGEVSHEALGQSAAQIARRIGLSRQAVQRTTNELVAAGMATYSNDPDDRRSQLVAITEQGKAALAVANDRQKAWLEAFGSALGGEALDSAVHFLRAAEAIAGALPEVASNVVPVTSDAIEREVILHLPPLSRQVKRVRAFEGVSDHILSKIKDGTLVPGHKLPAERELAATLSVGRPAVREALRSLEMSGVLRFERGASGGAFVRETGSDGMALSIRNMLILGRLPLTDLLEVRATLLGQCARLGTDRASSDDLDKMERNIDDLEDRILTVDDQMASIGPATDFYRLAARAAHNPVMVMLVDAMADLVAEMLASLHHWPRLDAAAISARRQMVAAMRAGNGDVAERVIRLHSHDTNQLLLKYEETLQRTS